MWKAIIKIGQYVATHPWVWALVDQVNRNIIKPIAKKLKTKKDAEDKKDSGHERPKTGNDTGNDNNK